MQTGNITEQIQEIRRQALTVLEDLTITAKKFDLPEPPDSLEKYSRKLRDNDYTVLVVGEAKRGKSTLVNALVGQDILPTDVDVATSQVFKISPSAWEDYRLRFEDGSERQISREDLPFYGSQVMADAGRAPTLDRVVRWIEVDIPVQFLPEGVSLLDTPGSGTLFASHARITHRFVPEADAVIFVLDSGQPVVEEDLTFIEEILGVTLNIFFVQTKIDLFVKEHWQAIQQRSQEILGDKFKGRLADTRVWPISSTNLRKAALEGDKTKEAYLLVSRYKEFHAALQAFLARFRGWRMSAEAMLMAAHYHSTGLKILSGRLAGTVENPSGEHVDLRQAASLRKQQFDADWAPNGRKLGELKAEIKKVIYIGKQTFAAFLRPGGDIDLTQRAKIDAITSLAEANRFAKEMPEEVTSAAIKKWSDVCKEVQDRCAELLGSLAEAAESISIPVEWDPSSIKVPDSGVSAEFKHDYSAMLITPLSRGLLFAGGGTIFNILLPNAVVAALAAPAAIVAAPALIAVASVAIRSALKGELASTKQQLKTALREVLVRVQSSFFDVDLATGRLGLVDEYFSNFQRITSEQIATLVRQKSKEAKGEIARLTAAAALDDQQREMQSQLLREQQAEWGEIGKRAKDVMTRIKALQGGETVPTPE